MEKSINKAIKVLKKGGVILYPTDTVWGLGCDATNDEAVQRIFDIKKRNSSKSLIVLLDSNEKIKDYVACIPKVANEMLDNPVRPTTVIYPKGKNISELVKAKDGSVGIRITSEAFSNELVKRFGKPLVSTSANVSSEKTPLSFSEIPDEIKSEVDYIVEYRQNDERPHNPSSVIKLESNGEIVKIR